MRKLSQITQIAPGTVVIGSLLAGDREIITLSAGQKFGTGKSQYLLKAAPFGAPGEREIRLFAIPLPEQVAHLPGIVLMDDPTIRRLQGEKLFPGVGRIAIDEASLSSGLWHRGIADHWESPLDVVLTQCCVDRKSPIFKQVEWIDQHCYYGELRSDRSDVVRQVNRVVVPPGASGVVKPAFDEDRQVRRGIGRVVGAAYHIQWAERVYDDGHEDRAVLGVTVTPEADEVEVAKALAASMGLPDLSPVADKMGLHWPEFDHREYEGATVAVDPEDYIVLDATSEEEGLAQLLLDGLLG